jgi:hypothetical protein
VTATFEAVMDWIIDTFAMLLLGVGTMLGLAGGKRRFDRTNAFGIERFPTFGAKLRSRSGYVLIGGAMALLAGGALLLAFNHIDTWGWIVVAPVGLFMLYLLIGT